MTIQEAAASLSVSTRTVRRMIDRGDLSCVRVGGQLRIEETAVRGFIERNRQGEDMGTADIADLDVAQIIGEHPGYREAEAAIAAAQAAKDAADAALSELITMTRNHRPLEQQMKFVREWGGDKDALHAEIERRKVRVAEAELALLEANQRREQVVKEAVEPFVEPVNAAFADTKLRLHRLGQVRSNVVSSFENARRGVHRYGMTIRSMRAEMVK